MNILFEIIKTILKISKLIFINLLDTRFLYTLTIHTIQDIYRSGDVSWSEYIGYKIYRYFNYKHNKGYKLELTIHTIKDICWNRDVPGPSMLDTELD